MWSYQSFHRQIPWSAALSKAVGRVGDKRSAIQTRKCQNAKKKTPKGNHKSCEEFFLRRNNKMAGGKSKGKEKNSRIVPLKIFSLWKCTGNTCRSMPATYPEQCSGPAAMLLWGRPWFTADCLKHPIMRLQTWSEAQPKKKSVKENAMGTSSVNGGKFEESKKWIMAAYHFLFPRLDNKLVGKKAKNAGEKKSESVSCKRIFS